VFHKRCNAKLTVYVKLDVSNKTLSGLLLWAKIFERAMAKVQGMIFQTNTQNGIKVTAKSPDIT
jgi:hypothetical protein